MVSQSRNPLGKTLRLASAQTDSLASIVDDYAQGAADRTQVVQRLSALHAHHAKLTRHGQTLLADTLRDALIDDPMLSAILDEMVVMSGVRVKE